MISALPSELVLLVIEHLLLLAEDSPRAFITSLITATSISSRWRNIANGCSSFWANIYVKPYETPIPWRQTRLTQILANDFDRVRCFLDRSKRSPIRLFVFLSWKDLNLYPTIKRTAAEENWGLMEKLIAPHMDRCRSMSIHFKGARASSEIHKFSNTRKFSVLEDLVIDFRDTKEDKYHNWDTMWNISPEFTPLRTLKFSDTWRYIPRAIDVSWPLLSLIELKIATHFWPRVCETLANLPSLKEFRISLGAGLIEDPPRTTRISLPLVERVTTNNSAIWYDISTPFLRYAAFTAIPFHPRIHAQEFDPMQAKLLQLLAEMPIHDVTFSGTAMDREFIFPMLQALDHVENLHFHQSSKHGKLLDRISQVLERGSTERQLGEHTNSDVNVNLFLPLLHTVSIEEAKGLYWMFWEFPNRLSEPPNWVVRQEQKPKTEGTWKTLKGCDQCKVDKTRCNLLLKQGCSCTRCDDKSLDCKIETNTAVMEARDTQKAMNRLQGLDIKVNWALR